MISQNASKPWTGPQRNKENMGAWASANFRNTQVYHCRALWLGSGRWVPSPSTVSSCQNEGLRHWQQPMLNDFEAPNLWAEPCQELTPAAEAMDRSSISSERYRRTGHLRIVSAMTAVITDLGSPLEISKNITCKFRFMWKLRSPAKE
eukprot:Skav214817  [mRNA]  locus=scaffold1934:165579:166022:+ [translate_table: standard]